MNKEENTYQQNSPNPGDFKACIVWMRDCVSSESNREERRYISGAGAGKAHEERKSEEGFQKYRSDRGAGCIDYGCIDIDQYADTGTDHKYP